MHHENLTNEEWGIMGGSHSRRTRPVPDLLQRKCAVNHSITNSWTRFRKLKRVLTDTKLQKSLCLRRFGNSVVWTLLVLLRIVQVNRRNTQKASRGKFENVFKNTGREIAGLLRAGDLRWNWIGHILRMDERGTVR